MAQVVHPSSVAFRSIDRVGSSPTLNASPAQSEPQPRLPVQAVPVNRLDIPHPYLVDYGPFRAIPEADPQPDSHSYFSSEFDLRLGICTVLSPQSAGRCLWTRGLF
jgi:hypothetical protein